MKYVKVIDGVVVQKQPNAQEGFIQAPDDVVCGWLYDGTTFTAPVIPQPSEEELLQEWRENTEVGPLQLRRALRQMGEMATVKNYMETQATEEEQEAWEYATRIPRLDPIVTGLIVILEKTEAEADQLFELALTFP